MLLFTPLSFQQQQIDLHAWECGNAKRLPVGGSADNNTVPNSACRWFCQQYNENVIIAHATTAGVSER
jgi:predicted pyridoxine 5'-phosphate oxidase superfamily flavin-nucleotide-binding protein